MSVRGKRVVLRREAVRSIDDAVDHYLQEAGAAVALKFVAALEEAWRHLRDFPSTGALRYGAELTIPGLRFWPLNKFPYLVFYIEREDEVDVLLVLHGSRDIPASLQADA
ncbi:type II toxin-antitoxin system RelE/ParE family toxin [Rivibacter subsaxonicus]|uniref:Toxin ParE1/3/4 n=1 Tax=Rivibacter subsaxonicus TaxID=457575 RepID=A0A4Q7V8Y9_9BURK|nr:type II toxin-antitoxin system RelE/ParE family toxin [Rivibacter subsaxonicus]RZT91980.1 toxin ParE1/3/4 [Rivibacter subsaxonicus]